MFSLAFGGVAALAGIGGGTLFTPYFKAAGMEPKLAIGTSAAIGLPISLAGALTYAWEGRNVPLGHWMIGYIMLTAPQVPGGAACPRAGRDAPTAPPPPA